MKRTAYVALITTVFVAAVLLFLLERSALQFSGVKTRRPRRISPDKSANRKFWLAIASGSTGSRSARNAS